TGHRGECRATRRLRRNAPATQSDGREATRGKPVSEGLTSTPRQARILPAGGSSPRRRQGGAQIRCQRWRRREAPPDQLLRPPPGAAEAFADLKTGRERRPSAPPWGPWTRKSDPWIPPATPISRALYVSRTTRR